MFLETAMLDGGASVADLFDVPIARLRIPETLEVSIEAMVRAEVVEAYGQLRRPCFVEHAGLIFEDHGERNYPGGLTKPMWNALGDQFVRETQSARRRASAVAVVAYCDGMSVRTFQGETHGSIADGPRGDRAFYWDTVFIPDDAAGKPGTLTYSEIVEQVDGLATKIERYSQSAKAMRQLFAFLQTTGLPWLWE